MPPLVFPFEPNTREQVVEGYGFRTDIMQARTGLEQRVALRERADGYLDFTFYCQDREAQLLQNLFSVMDQPWAVPLWPWDIRLTVEASPGDSVVSCDSETVPFYDSDGIGRWALIWVDPFAYELLKIQPYGPTPGTLILDGVAVAGTWAAGTRIIPVRVGRLDPGSAFNLESPWLAAGRPRFHFETADEWLIGPTVVSDPLDILELTHSRDVDDAVDVQGRYAVIESGMGARARDLWGAPPSTSRKLAMRFFSRQEILDFRAWLDARCGRAVPFYYPTRNRDMTLAFDAVSGSSSITIIHCGYTTYSFGTSGARRRIRIWKPGTDPQDRFITASVDNADGTETLTLGAPLDADIDASYAISYLLYSRLDEDTVEFVYDGKDFASVSLPIRDLSLEAPTS